MTALSFAHPWLLAALAVLPVLWWVLRATPPAPRRQAFPAIALLIGLAGPHITASRTPWWLLLLRLGAAGLAIVALAGPVRDAIQSPRTAAGPVVLIIDNGWAAAADWSDRMTAAARSVAEAAPPDGRMQVLATAPDADGAPPALGPVIPAGEAAARLAALRPMPWPVDRASAARALQSAPPNARIIAVADGLAGEAAADAQFARALRRFSGILELRGGPAPLLLRPPIPNQDGFELRAETLPGHAGSIDIRGIAGSGEVVADTGLGLGAGGAGRGTLVLPPELRNRLAALRIGASASAGAVALLDEATKRRPVGLLARGAAADEPLVGSLFYVRRALGDGAELRGGDVKGLLGGRLSVIVAADQSLAGGNDLAALTGWVRGGGVLIRFAGPNLAAATGADPLLPVALLAGDRALGGAMSWSRPAALAPFAAESPFAGLTAPADVRISRQVLAQPGDAPDRPGRQDWASLADGTPLVTAAPLGAGRLVLFHVTANADWSNLPLSGLFPDMLRRLVALSAGVKPQADDATLAPLRALDGFGQLGSPGAAARPLSGAAFATTIPSPAHPPGLYGPGDAARALNLGAALPPPMPAPPIAGAAQRGLGGAAAPRAYGPALLAAAMLLLALDLLIALRLRGLLAAAAAALLVLAPLRARAAPPMPSLATHLGFVETGDGQADGIARAGLQGLSDYVNARTAAVLADPVGVDPAQDDLSFYPLLYWPVLADAPVPDGAALARLDDYMQNGGIIVFDTRDAAAPDAAAQAALRRLGAALSIPALAPLTASHVLSHSFYLLRDWPGRLDGGTVWIARTQDRANDNVSPVIIGANDWASAWAVDDSGANPYDASPGGEGQRVLAYRFGVNLVMYALTGNYKADQVHVPELLRRMGQDPDASPVAPAP